MTAGRPWDVGIIGCGTAGAAAALFLAREGHRITVYERVPDPGAVGAGVLIQPTGQRVLQELGLLEPVLARGARVTGLRCVTPRNRPIVEIAYRNLGPDQFGLGVHRGVLFETLFRATRGEPGITVRCGIEIEDLAAQGARNFVVEKESRQRHGPHDLIVVADGARSQLRDDTALHKRVTPYPWGAVWCILEDPQRAFPDTLYQVADGTRRLVGFLPTGRGPGAADGPPLVSLFWSVQCDRVDRECRGDRFLPWKEEILRYIPQAETVLAQLTSPDQVLFSRYLDVRMATWNTANVVYLGDAAHATSPQLGQGCNLALLDAATLGRSIAAHPELPAALDAYSRARRRHLAYYQFATRALTLLFQSDHAFLGPLRDLGMGLGGRLPWINRQMTLTMAGVSLGPFARLDNPAK